MKTIAFIPARGGSKGVPGKNLRIIAGKPLIVWSIEQALEASLVDEVFVSTDSQEIADIALKAGASVPFLRPVEISGDHATTESAMLHFCDFMKTQGIYFETLMLLQATSPVRAPGRLDDAISFFTNGNYDSVLSVTESHRFFWQNPNEPSALYDYKNRPRRQDIKDRDRKYMETGSLYIVDRQKFLDSKNRLCGRIGMYLVPEIESYEIDSVIDFSVCEILLQETK